MHKRDQLLYSRVYRELRARILTGHYAPGDQIETESELTVQMKASIITIRQAAQMLADEGLLDKQQGRGTFVPQSALQHLKILGVCGLNLSSALQHHMSPYFSDLLMLSKRAATQRGVGFETAWLPASDRGHIRPYCDEPKVREYLGFVFFACGPDHLLLQRVRTLRLRYVVISAFDRPGEPRRVWLDYPQAFRLALAQFNDTPGAPLLVMGIDSLQRQGEEAVKELAVKATQVYLSGDEQQVTYETSGYQRMLALIQAGQDISRVVFLDDLVAQGATRAMLKAGIREQDVKLVIIRGQQEAAPLGYPATFVMHDTQEEVNHAFAMLDRQPQKGAARSQAWCSGFRVFHSGTA